MNRIIFLKLCLWVTLTMPQHSFAQMSIETVFPCVTFIQGAKVQTVSEGGRNYDVYLRDRETKEIKPMFIGSTGTAFFVSNEVDVYLVTAEHVARGTAYNSSIVVSSKNNFPVLIPLQNLLEKSDVVDGQVKWIFHPKADVAVVRVNIPHDLPDSVMIAPLPLELVRRELKVPARHTNLTIYGYPLSLGVGARTSPLSKTYHAASGLIDLPRFDTHVPNIFFLIDDPSISGLSGGPVFALIQYSAPMNLSLLDETGLVGLVHGTINKDGGGYAAIVPSKYIAETIDLAPSFSGLHMFKYPDGKVWSEVVFKNGIAWDVLSNFDAAGKPHEKGTLKHGNGTRYIYDENGKLRSIYHYANGKKFRDESIEEN